MGFVGVIKREEQEATEGFYSATAYTRLEINGTNADSSWDDVPTVKTEEEPLVMPMTSEMGDLVDVHNSKRANFESTGGLGAAEVKREVKVEEEDTYLLPVKEEDQQESFEPERIPCRSPSVAAGQEEPVQDISVGLRARCVVEAVMPVPQNNELRALVDSPVIKLEPLSPSSLDGSTDIAGGRGSVHGNDDEPNVIRSEEAEDDVAAFMAQRENPILKKAKKKDELVALPVDTVYHIIKQTGLTDMALPEVDIRVRDTFVSRYLISEVLGGSPQDTFPTPRPEKVAEHGIKAYICLVEAFNPLAPQLPGRTGLYFSSTRNGVNGGREKDDTIYPYFMRVDNNKWHYLGHYKLRRGRPLTIEEWKQQSPLCKRTWIKDTATTKRCLSDRAYVRLRRGLEDEDEVKVESIKAMETEMAKNKRLDDVSLEEIESAFDRGHLSIDAVGMQCVRYDVAFQQSLFEKSLKRAPSNANSKGVKRKPRVKNESDDEVRIVSVAVKKSAVSRRKSAPRRYSKETLTSKDELDDVIDIDNLENIREYSYVAKGTRSRPAKKARTIVI